MAKRYLRSLIFKAALIAGILALSPALRAQTARTGASGSLQFDALPSAISPAIESTASARASYSAQTVSTIHISEQNTIKPTRNIGVESYPSRRGWLLLSAAAHGAATFDAYSTRQSIAAGNVETDPLIRPFANSPAIYAAIQASPLVMDFAALKMQHSSNHFVRRLWWVPQSTGAAMSLFAGAHNLSIAHR